MLMFRCAFLVVQVVAAQLTVDAEDAFPHPFSPERPLLAPSSERSISNELDGVDGGGMAASVAGNSGGACTETPSLHQARPTGSAGPPPLQHQSARSLQRARVKEQGRGALLDELGALSSSPGTSTHTLTPPTHRPKAIRRAVQAAASAAPIDAPAIRWSLRDQPSPLEAGGGAVASTVPASPHTLAANRAVQPGPEGTMAQKRRRRRRQRLSLDQLAAVWVPPARSAASLTVQLREARSCAELLDLLQVGGNEPLQVVGMAAFVAVRVGGGITGPTD
jgi:hypothetical protein